MVSFHMWKRSQLLLVIFPAQFLLLHTVIIPVMSIKIQEETNMNSLIFPSSKGIKKFERQFLCSLLWHYNDNTVLLSVLKLCTCRFVSFTQSIYHGCNSAIHKIDRDESCCFVFRLEVLSERNDMKRFPYGSYVDIEHHLLRLALVTVFCVWFSAN